VIRLTAACVMTFDQKISVIKTRIARAESERDIWRASGKEEKHLEAYFLVEALELQLERLRQAVRPSGLKNDAPIPVDYARLQGSTAPASDGRPVPPAKDVETPDASQRRLMSALAITFKDGVYHLGTYRYERLVDAANYARLQLAEGS
jgi:hypothetical protein